jgi:hypothetical protein
MRQGRSSRTCLSISADGVLDRSCKILQGLAGWETDQSMQAYVPSVQDFPNALENSRAIELAMNGSLNWIVSSACRFDIGDKQTSVARHAISLAIIAAPETTVPVTFRMVRMCLKRMVESWPHIKFSAEQSMRLLVEVLARERNNTPLAESKGIEKSIFELDNLMQSQRILQKGYKATCGIIGRHKYNKFAPAEEMDSSRTVMKRTLSCLRSACVSAIDDESVKSTSAMNRRSSGESVETRSSGVTSPWTITPGVAQESTPDATSAQSLESNVSAKDNKQGNDSSPGRSSNQMSGMKSSQHSTNRGVRNQQGAGRRRSLRSKKQSSQALTMHALRLVDAVGIDPEDSEHLSWALQNSSGS